MKEIILIKDGKPMQNNLKISKLSMQEIQSYFDSLGVKSIKNVGVFTLDGSGRYYLQEFNKKYTTGKMQLKEGVSW